MKPSLRYAQAIPGRTDGRGIGIIESRVIPQCNEGLALLAGSGAWTAEDAAQLRAWMEAFHAWLTTSANGLDEADEANNHGTWYDVQVAHLALVLDRRDEARRVLEAGRTGRLAKQVRPDGSQPHELARTKSLSYSLFNLEAMVALARLGERVGVDWWGFKAGNGACLGAAIRFLAPFADPARPWIRKDIKDAERMRLLPLLAEALRHREDEEFRALLLRHGASAGAAEARWNLAWSPGE